MQAWFGWDSLHEIVFTILVSNASAWTVCVMTTPAGWYPDSNNSLVERYWDGSAWTEYTRPASMAPGAPSTELDNSGPVSGLGDLFGSPTLEQEHLQGWQQPPVSELADSIDHTPWGAPTSSAWGNPEQFLTNDQDWQSAPQAPWQPPQSVGSSAPWEMPEQRFDQSLGGARSNNAETPWGEGDRVAITDSHEIAKAPRGRRGSRKVVSRVAGGMLAVFALMVWMAESDREKEGLNSLGTQIPVTDSPGNSPADGDTSPSTNQGQNGVPGPTQAPTITPGATDALGNPIPTPAGTSSASPTLSSTSTEKYPLPGVLDPTLLAPDTYSTGFSGRNGVVMSFIDSANFEDPKIRYEIRVYSKAGLKVVKTAETTLTISGISRTNCRVEIRSLKDNRRSNPLNVGCNATG